jgi:hypothetical protein
MTGKERPKPWSLAGSARFARDARIAAVRYMRHAQVERDWYAAMLAHGHQARAATSGDPDAARALQFATMGYPPPYPCDWDQDRSFAETRRPTHYEGVLVRCSRLQSRP